jgi:hypothetical protein
MIILINLKVEMIFSHYIIEIIHQNQIEITCIHLFGPSFKELSLS